MLQIQYLIKTGRKLDLKNPNRFTEKIQWYKLYYKNPIMPKCVDKYDVRDYIKSKGLESILTHCYGIYDKVEDIPWTTLPNQFVIKDTLGGGGNSICIVKNKSTTSIDLLESKAQSWIAIDSRKKGGGREWPYYHGKKHRIIIEEYINSDETEEGLVDYKFFCFNGKVEFLYVMGNRSVGQSVEVSIFDRNFNKLPVRRVGDKEFKNAKKPTRFDEMIKIAEQLALDFPHVRVDLYNVEGRILFGELTFYNASGYMEYEPDSFDLEIGTKWELPKIMIEPSFNP